MAPLPTSSRPGTSSRPAAAVAPPPPPEPAAAAGAQVLGPAAILAQSPESRPLKTKRSPAPAVHATSRAVRRELRNAYFLFVAA